MTPVLSRESSFSLMAVGHGFDLTVGPLFQRVDQRAIRNKPIDTDLNPPPANGP
jgi:hypothetical protein